MRIETTPPEPGAQPASKRARLDASPAESSLATDTVRHSPSEAKTSTWNDLPEEIQARIVQRLPLAKQQNVRSFNPLRFDRTVLPNLGDLSKTAFDLRKTPDGRATFELIAAEVGGEPIPPAAQTSVLARLHQLRTLAAHQELRRRFGKHPQLNNFLATNMSRLGNRDYPSAVRVMNLTQLDALGQAQRTDLRFRTHLRIRLAGGDDEFSPDDALHFVRNIELTNAQRRNIASAFDTFDRAVRHDVCRALLGRLLETDDMMTAMLLFEKHAAHSGIVREALIPLHNHAFIPGLLEKTPQLLFRFLQGTQPRHVQDMVIEHLPKDPELEHTNGEMHFRPFFHRLSSMQLARVVKIMPDNSQFLMYAATYATDEATRAQLFERQGLRPGVRARLAETTRNPAEASRFLATLKPAGPEGVLKALLPRISHDQLPMWLAKTLESSDFTALTIAALDDRFIASRGAILTHMLPLLEQGWHLYKNDAQALFPYAETPAVKAKLIAEGDLKGRILAPLFADQAECSRVVRHLLAIPRKSVTEYIAHVDDETRVMIAEKGCFTQPHFQKLAIHGDASVRDAVHTRLANCKTAKTWQGDIFKTLSARTQKRDPGPGG